MKRSPSNPLLNHSSPPLLAPPPTMRRIVSVPALPIDFVMTSAAVMHVPSHRIAECIATHGLPSAPSLHAADLSAADMNLGACIATPVDSVSTDDEETLEEEAGVAQQQQAARRRRRSDAGERRKEREDDDGEERAV